MAMNAAAQSLIALMTGANLRFVIPVYQRPYSWDEEHCLQLWEDILSVGRRPQDRHFTGSIVWVQDGTMSASGVTPLLLIDGQQRMTTLTLLLVALANFDRSHPDRTFRFSHGEITGRGYLIDKYKEGEDQYKLTLSQGDKETLISILENLINDKIKIRNDSSRIINNLEFFSKRIEALEDPNIVWDGILRLDVVSISLDAGKDNPQLIFESMNSTGKDLSSADLIRNYVLMGLPREEQDNLYLNYWRHIEETLGADSYDEIFDEFVRNYLTVLYAPEPLAKRDVYPLFKRHVLDGGYDKGDRIKELLEELEAFARYYSAITNGTEPHKPLKEVFDRLVRLKVSVVNPLLLSLYEDYEAEAFELSDFVSMAQTLESYIFRRTICDAATSSLNKFFSSIIAKLNRVQADKGNYREAFESLLFLEAGTARRFPTDSEFEQALLTRDVYHFRRASYLLENLENMHHPKDPINFVAGTYTIEHIMPQNAMAHDEWREAIGENADERFEPLVNNLGNLTLTAYNAELSDGTFKEKKERVVGGFDKEWLVISKAVHDAESWTPEEINSRAHTLATYALERWPFLNIAADVASNYESKPEKNPLQRVNPSFRTVFDAGFITPGTVLIPASERIDVAAEVTKEGRIKLPNGEIFESPSGAAVRAVALGGHSGTTRNGWRFWRVRDGKQLFELKNEYLNARYSEDGLPIYSIRSRFWSDFYETCAQNEAFVEAFGDPSERYHLKDSWVSFGIGDASCRLDALLYVYDQLVGAELYCRNADRYLPLLAARKELDDVAVEQGVAILWDDVDMDKQSRVVRVQRSVDLDNDDWRDYEEWIASWMLRFREFAYSHH